MIDLRPEVSALGPYLFTLRLAELAWHEVETSNWTQIHDENQHQERVGKDLMRKFYEVEL